MYPIQSASCLELLGTPAAQVFDTAAILLLMDRTSIKQEHKMSPDHDRTTESIDVVRR